MAATRRKVDGLPGHEARFRVPFHDLDPLQIVWHGNFLKYFDVAREGLFQRLGIDLYDFYLRTGCLFPIIRSHVKHIRPLYYHDEFVCRAALVECKRRLVVEFEVRRLESRDLCAMGRTEQAAMSMPEMELLFLIPEELRTLLDRQG